MAIITAKSKSPQAQLRDTPPSLPHAANAQIPHRALQPLSRRFVTIKFMSKFPPGQTLLIDADDTLWENNVYFERAIAAFIGYLNHHAYTPTEVRKALNAVERETILAHGYGLTSFTRSLVTCFERLSPQPLTEEKRSRIVSFAQTIADQEIELLPGVDETLVDLRHARRLVLVGMAIIASDIKSTAPSWHPRFMRSRSRKE